MAKAATAPRGTELDVIDRLEEKVRLLVSMIERMKGEQARTAEENQRLAREVDALHARLAQAEDAGAEVALLREERDLIRSRVSEMLEQIESLDL